MTSGTRAISLILRYLFTFIVISLTCTGMALADTASLDSTVIKEQKPDGSYIWKLSAKTMELLESTINLKNSQIEIYGDNGDKTAIIESNSGTYDTNSKLITLSNSKIYLIEEKMSIISPYIKIDTSHKQLKANNAVITDEHNPNSKLISKELSSNFNLNYFTHKGFELRAAVE